LQFIGSKNYTFLLTNCKNNICLALARLFTLFTESREDTLLLTANAISTLLNGIVFAQILLYWENSKHLVKHTNKKEK
jgi:hypothetical protein